MSLLKYILTLIWSSADDSTELTTSKEPVKHVSGSAESLKTLASEVDNIPGYTETSPLEAEDSLVLLSSHKHEKGGRSRIEAAKKSNETAGSFPSGKQETNQNELKLSITEDLQDNKRNSFLKGSKNYEEDLEVVTKAGVSDIAGSNVEKFESKERREIKTEDDDETISDQPVESQGKNEIIDFGDFPAKNSNNDSGDSLDGDSSADTGTENPDSGETSAPEGAKRERRSGHDCSVGKLSAKGHLRGHGRTKRNLQMGFLHMYDPNSKATKGKKPKIVSLFESKADQIRRSNKRKSGW